MSIETTIVEQAARMGVSPEALVLCTAAAASVLAMAAIRAVQEGARAGRGTRPSPPPADPAPKPAPPQQKTAPLLNGAAARTPVYQAGLAPYERDPCLSPAAEFLTDMRLDAARQTAMAALADSENDPARARAAVALADIALAARDSGAALSHALTARRLADASGDPRLAAHALARQGAALRLTTNATAGEALLAEACAALREQALDGEASAVAQRFA